jgi:hypothetical protein
LPGVGQAVTFDRELYTAMDKCLAAQTRHLDGVNTYVPLFERPEATEVNARWLLLSSVKAMTDQLTKPDEQAKRRRRDGAVARNRGRGRYLKRSAR